MSYTSTVSPSLRQFHLFFLPENFHRRSHECSLEQTTFVGSNWSTQSTGSIWGVYTASTCSISGFGTADALYTPSISGFDTVDTPVFAVLLLLILPLLAVFRPSVLLILPASAVFRPSVLLILPVLAVRNVLDTPSILEVRSILGASLQASSPSGALHDLNGGRTRFLVAPGPRSQRVPSGDPT